MIITEEQAKNGYPIEAVKFMNTFDDYLSNEVDKYGIKKCKSDSFDSFFGIGANYPKKLKEQYDDYVKQIHKYLDEGNEL